ncbi:unnamed protein product [Pelagomonas calceolata]|uniref:FHA domain-containing protein n=2 Tax=Pelagomonas calceolata TaxID=35677 RepID=A0A8J2T213_9STRA|nr:unnamed protein product [Pelagomonas calceolata]
MEHDRACWGVLRRTKGDAAFPEVIPLCATRVVVGRRPEHYEAPDTVFRTASAHDDALPDVTSTQIDRVALEASKRLSKVHCIFQRTEDTNAVVECHTNNGFAVNQAPVGKGTRASLSDGDGVQLLGDGPGQPGVSYELALRGAPTWRAGAVFYDAAVVAALRARGETRRATLKALREVATRLEAANNTVMRATDTRHRLIMKRRGKDARRELVDDIAAARGAAADAFEGGQAALAAGRAALAAVASRGPVLAAPASGDALEPDALDAVLPTPTPAARPEPNALEPYDEAEPTDSGGSSPQSDAVGATRPGGFQYDVSQTQDDSISPLTSPSAEEARRASQARWYAEVAPAADEADARREAERRADEEARRAEAQRRADEEARRAEEEARRAEAARRAEEEARRLSQARRAEAEAVAARAEEEEAARRASQERRDHALAVSLVEPPARDSEEARRASQERRDHEFALRLNRAPTPRARAPPRQRHFFDEPDDDASDEGGGDVADDRPSAVKIFTELARGDGDASELLRRGLEAQNNRPAAVRARRALLAVAEEDFHWWKKPLATDEEDDDSVPEVPGTTI